MSEGWQKRPLGELVQNLDGKRVPVKEADRKRGPYPYYGASGVVDYVDGFLFEGLHLLVAEDGENLRTRKLPVAFLADGRFWVNNHAHVVRGNAEADTRFLCYALQQADISAFLSGSTMPKLTQGNLLRIPVLTPPLPEQRAIAATLGALDDKIELNRKMNATLEAMARALFRDWFVDFGPTRAKMEGREPYLSPDLWSLFPDRLDDEGKPEGWVDACLGDVADIVKGRSYKSAELQPSTTALVTLKSFSRGGGYRPDGLKPYVGEYKPSQLITDGEVVVALTDVTQAAELIGRPARVAADGRFITLVASLDVAIIRPKPTSSVTREFLFGTMATNEFTTHTFAHTSGTTVLHLGKDAIPAYQFLLPHEQLIAAFEELLTPLRSRQKVNHAELVTLAETRDLLLPRLMSGELRVAEAERLVDEVV